MEVSLTDKIRAILSAREGGLEGCGGRVGTGPTFRRVGGKILYNMADIRAWDQSRAGDRNEKPPAT